VYGTFTDACCLILLVLLLRREGLRLRDSFGVTRANRWQQLRAAPMYLLAILPAVAASSLITLPFYGPGAVPPQVASLQLPPWAAAYSIAIWPIVWAFTEELVYLGFILPRLEVAFGNKWVAAAVTVFFWTTQHLAIPFIADPAYLVSRWLGALMITAAMTVTFLLLRRRLLAATVVHWFSDAATAASAILFLTH
jgi:membrane protease YdiL (CAAX protease family)